MLRLTIRNGSKAGKTVDVEPDATMVVGRGEAADLRLRDTRVSRKHAKIAYTDEGWVIQDLNSTNGTSVNRRPIVTRWPLEIGDLLQIGRVFLLVEAITDGQPSRRPRPTPKPDAAEHFDQVRLHEEGDRDAGFAGGSDTGDSALGSSIIHPTAEDDDEDDAAGGSWRDDEPEPPDDRPLLPEVEADGNGSALDAGNDANGDDDMLVIDESDTFDDDPLRGLVGDDALDEVLADEDEEDVGSPSRRDEGHASAPVESDDQAARDHAEADASADSVDTAPAGGGGVATTRRPKLAVAASATALALACGALWWVAPWATGYRAEPSLPVATEGPTPSRGGDASTAASRPEWLRELPPPAPVELVEPLVDAPPIDDAPRLAVAVSPAPAGGPSATPRPEPADALSGLRSEAPREREPVPEASSPAAAGGVVAEPADESSEASSVVAVVAADDERVDAVARDAAALARAGSSATPAAVVPEPLDAPDVSFGSPLLADALITTSVDDARERGISEPDSMSLVEAPPTTGEPTQDHAAPAAEPALPRPHVFIIDASGSMIDSMPFALRALRREVADVPDGERFAVLVSQAGRVTEPPPGGVRRSDPGSRWDVVSWLARDDGPVYAGGPGDASAAIAAAMAYDAGSITVISDNRFALPPGASSPAAWPDAVAELAGWAEAHAVAFHAIQMFYGEGEGVLPRLAERLDGTYRFVRPESLEPEDTASIGALLR